MSDETDRQPDQADATSPPDNEMVVLERDGCLELLSKGGIGRIAVSVPGRDYPVIRPVNYVFDKSSQSVLIRSDTGSKLHALLRSRRAAFEIDGTDDVGRVGWSVVIRGICEEIANPAEVRRAQGLGLESWAPGYKGHLIRIHANSVSGRRIVSSHQA